MACFMAPALAAGIATAGRKKISARLRPDWLILMLWGGTVMLVVDHIISGELVWYPPFLTAGWDKILPEIIKVGGSMTLTVLAIWLIMIAIANKNSARLWRTAD